MVLEPVCWLLDNLFPYHISQFLLLFLTVLQIHSLSLSLFPTPYLALLTLTEITTFSLLVQCQTSISYQMVSKYKICLVFHCQFKMHAEKEAYPHPHYHDMKTQWSSSFLSSFFSIKHSTFSGYFIVLTQK